MTSVTLKGFQEIYDFDKSCEMVLATLDKCQNVVEFIRLINRYASWNGVFGSAVASLSGKVGTAQRVFRDEDYKWNGIHYPALADRSVLVASYMFEAARDEFDDRDFPDCRTTHRCLAQATVVGCLEYLVANETLTSDIAAGLLDRPKWLDFIEHGVLCGYGHSTPDTMDFIFHAMGFHLGSEILADQEFSIFDEFIQSRFPDLHKYLLDTEVVVAGTKFPAYSWMRIHSGHGKHVEADHFESALEGVNLGLGFIPTESVARMQKRLNSGFLDFARNREDFFNQV